MLNYAKKNITIFGKMLVFIEPHIQKRRILYLYPFIIFTSYNLNNCNTSCLKKEHDWTKESKKILSFQTRSRPRLQLSNFSKLFSLWKRGRWIWKNAFYIAATFFDFLSFSWNIKMHINMYISVIMSEIHNQLQIAINWKANILSWSTGFVLFDHYKSIPIKSP